MVIYSVPPDKLSLLMQRHPFDARNSKKRWQTKWRNRRARACRIMAKRAFGYHAIYSIYAEMKAEKNG